MFVGFDYGTSNCAMSSVRDGQAALIPLFDDDYFVPSTLYAIERSFVAEIVSVNLPEGEDKSLFSRNRSALLKLARAAQAEHSLANINEGIFFGREAIAQYIAAPGEGYFIKSPKSFLGASGLRQQSVDFFEDVVAAMMLNVKKRAEQYVGETITQAVIGRPVNFQGINAEASNQQALAILAAAGKRAGFIDIEFLYEPLAAGFDFETRLTQNQCVLIVDVGGGTTDCSMVLMGPDHIQQLNRTQDFLGHTGERVGGNDFDIQFAQKLLLPEFGMLSPLSNGLPMPLMPFVNAVAINDVGAQAEFYDAKTGYLLENLKRDTCEPHLLDRFIKLREGRHNFALVRAAENGKIALSSADSYLSPLDFIESNLIINCSAQNFAAASGHLLQKISSLIGEVIAQSEVQPDVVYITGGSAKSPLIQQLVRNLFGAQTPLIDGDHFGSVAAGLGVWAQRVFK